MKRQSYLQQVASRAAASRREGVVILKPPRLLLRPGPKSFEALEIEATLVNASVPGPRAPSTAPSTSVAPSLTASRAMSEPRFPGTEGVTPGRGSTAQQQRLQPSLDLRQEIDAFGRRPPSPPARPTQRPPTAQGDEAPLIATTVSHAASARATPVAKDDDAQSIKARPREIEREPPNDPRPQPQRTLRFDESLVQPANSAAPRQERAAPRDPRDPPVVNREPVPAQTAGGRETRLTNAVPRSPAPLRESARTSLHIGTLEVRVTTPAAALPAAPRQHTPRLSARSRGEARGIARGLGVFGLGQS
jgi:hypothetical protein